MSGLAHAIPNIGFSCLFIIFLCVHSGSWVGIVLTALFFLLMADVLHENEKRRTLYHEMLHQHLLLIFEPVPWYHPLHLVLAVYCILLLILPWARGLGTFDIAYLCLIGNLVWLVLAVVPGIDLPLKLDTYYSIITASEGPEWLRDHCNMDKIPMAVMRQYCLDRHRRVVHSMRVYKQKNPKWNSVGREDWMRWMVVHARPRICRCPSTTLLCAGLTAYARVPPKLSCMLTHPWLRAHTCNVHVMFTCCHCVLCGCRADILNFKDVLNCTEAHKPVVLTGANMTMLPAPAHHQSQPCCRPLQEWWQEQHWARTFVNGPQNGPCFGRRLVPLRMFNGLLDRTSENIPEEILKI